jgi:hypothetical protein
MNNPDHISKSLETIFWFKILKYFNADPGSGCGIRIRDGKNSDRGREKVRFWIQNPEKLPGSTTLLEMLYIEDD